MTTTTSDGATATTTHAISGDLQMECQTTGSGTSLSENDRGVNRYVKGDETNPCDSNEKNCNGDDEKDVRETEFCSNKEVGGASNYKNEKNELCPRVGMEFDSHEDAYTFYTRYAGLVGFSVRKYSVAKSQRTNEIICRRYSCSLEGHRDVRCKPFEERKRNRSNLRTGCMARMSIRKKGDKWVVGQFVEEHNHELVTPCERHKLRSLRKITKGQEQVFVDMRLPGVETDYIAREAGGNHNIGFIERDTTNLLSTKRQKELIKGDAQAVLDYFRRRQTENPSFVYSIQVDSEGQMTNFFWADARSRMDYYHFCDLAYVDASCGTNKYGIPFVPIVGINHHRRTVLFGGALLYDGSEESFEWLIKTWIQAMNGKQPKVILTDQETAIGGAVEHVLPGTCHRYCLWHISKNAMKNLPHINDAHESFIDDFSKCLYGCETVEEFESSWEAMLKRYDLEHNSWLLKLFEEREKWSPVYTRDVFSASICITQHSESINTYFDGYVKRSMTLSDFFKQYERVVVRRRDAEKEDDFETNHKIRVLRFSMEIEKEAADVYTRAIFQKFQNELFECFTCRHKKIEEIGSNSIYHVWREGHEQKIRTVSFNCSDTSVKCSCQLFDYAGYLCRHILKVFIAVDVHNLPAQYIIKRWTRDAKCGSVVDDQGEQIQSNSNDTFTVRFGKLCQEAVNIAVKGATSKESYRVAMGAFRNALKAVEAVLRNPSVYHMEQDREIGNEHDDKGGPILKESWIGKLPKSKKSTIQKTHSKTLSSVSRGNSAAMTNEMPHVTGPGNERIGENLSPSIAVTNNKSESSHTGGCDLGDLDSGDHHFYCSPSPSGLGFNTATQGSYMSNTSLDPQPNHQVYHLNQGASLVGQQTIPPFVSHNNLYPQRHVGDVGMQQSGQGNTLANVLTNSRQEGNFIDLNDSNQLDNTHLKRRNLL